MKNPFLYLVGGVAIAIYATVIGGALYLGYFLILALKKYVGA